MSRPGTNPVLAPIRRWVLYSRANLAISVFGVVVVLSVGGMVFGDDSHPRTVESSTASASEASLVVPTETVSYELDEVSESQVVAATATWIAASAPATAMAYVNTFVDTTLPDAQWIAALHHYTATESEHNAMAVRPRTPIVITGPTASTLVDGPDGTHNAQVLVPTQVGQVTVSLVVQTPSNETQHWIVDSPLPVLDMSAVENTQGQTVTTTTTATLPESTKPQPASTSAAVPTTDTQPTFDLGDTVPAPTSRQSDSPVPVPGPIPIPDLDTPIPGQL